MRKSLDSNDLGSISLNQCRRTTIKELHSEAKKRIPEMMQILYPGVLLDTTKCIYGGYRYWFGCSQCRRRCFTLYEHPISLFHICRKCLGLPYAKQRYKGMMEENIYK